MIEYRTIEDYPGYRIGNDGSVWSCLKRTGCAYYNDIEYVLSDEWHLLVACKSGKYKRNKYSLKHKDGAIKNCSGSHLVLLAFVGPCPNGMEACHEDGDCINDALYNLRWDTHQSNIDDRKRHKTTNVKLTDDEVKEIRDLRLQGETLEVIADIFDVSRGYVGSLVKGYYRK